MFCNIVGPIERWSKNFGVIATGLRGILQFAVGDHRRCIRILQVKRVEVELQEGQKGCAGQDGANGARDNRDTVSLQKAVQRRKSTEANRCRLAGRIQYRQHGGNQSDAAQESDDHSTSGDQPKLRQPLVAGGNEGKESNGSCACCQGEGAGHLSGGAEQGSAQIAYLMTFGTITNAELDPEIDPKSNEEHKECNRDQIEGSDHDQAECSRDCETDHKAKAN